MGREGGLVWFGLGLDLVVSLFYRTLGDQRK